jgi:hypothetical protein
MEFCNKKEVLIRSVLLLISFTVQAQMSSEIPDGRPFLKRSEYNSIGFGLYNVDSKTDIEKLFFGDFNAMVEFFILPSFEHHEGAYGFRVFRDSSQHCIIESKYITNWRAVISAVSTKFPTRSVHPDEKLTEEKKNEIWEYNRKMRDMQQKESLRLYEIASQSFPVNNLFAEKLHEIVVVAIDNFVGKGEPAVIKDGYKATFRCVVADEVWTLTVRQPKDQIKRLSDLCIQLIENMKTNQMDESNYIELFKNVMQ